MIQLIDTFVLSEGIQTRLRNPALVKSYVDRHAHPKSMKRFGRGEFRLGFRQGEGQVELFETAEGILLSNSGVELAFLGYEPLDGGVVVNQIQGLAKSGSFERPGHKLLRCLRWPDLMLSFARDVAVERGIPMAVIPAKRDGTYQAQGLLLIEGLLDRETAFMRQEKLVDRYDGTAQRCGFVYDSVRDLYVLPSI